MPDTGTDMIMTNWGRLIAIAYLIFFLYTCRRRILPIKLRGSKKPFFYYTGWRILPILGVPLVTQVIPVFLFGWAFRDMMETRDTLLAFLLFWGNVVGIPVTIIVVTILQMRANRRTLEKQKRDSF